MTQRIFDVENEKDMKDLWNILPDDIIKIEQLGPYNRFYTANSHEIHYFIKIIWHDKTEITRPIQEATKADIGKLCVFWDKNDCYYGILTNIIDYSFKYQMDNNSRWQYCRRLTKLEIEELC